MKKNRRTWIYWMGIIVIAAFCGCGRSENPERTENEIYGWYMGTFKDQTKNPGNTSASDKAHEDIEMGEEVEIDESELDVIDLDMDEARQHETFGQYLPRNIPDKYRVDYIKIYDPDKDNEKLYAYFADKTSDNGFSLIIQKIDNYGKDDMFKDEEPAPYASDIKVFIPAKEGIFANDYKYRIGVGDYGIEYAFYGEANLVEKDTADAYGMIISAPCFDESGIKK